MDQELRQLYRQYQADPGRYREVLQTQCQRIGLIGPVLADACQMLSRLFFAIIRRQSMLVTWAVKTHAQTARQLHRLTWDSSYQDLDTISIPDIEFQIQMLWNRYDDDRDHRDQWPAIPTDSFYKYLDTLLPLFLFINRKNYPVKIREGLEVLILETLSATEFAQKIGREMGSTKQKQWLTAIAKFLEEGFIDTSYHILPEDYENLAKILPGLVQEKLKKLWKNSDYLSFGSFLKEKHGDWFEPAINSGNESGQYGEMLEDFENFVNNVSWESGAVVSYVNVDELEIWISLKDLNQALKSGKHSYLGFMETLLEDLSESTKTRRPYWRDHYSGFDREEAKRYLLETMPEEFKN